MVVTLAFQTCSRGVGRATCGIVGRGWVEFIFCFGNRAVSLCLTGGAQSAIRRSNLERVGKE